jgi:hypothetical protein
MEMETQTFVPNYYGRPALNLTGQRFGRLRVLGPVRQVGGRTWLCECKCGKRSILLTHNLRSGNTKSCGCLRVDHARKMRARRNGVVTAELAIYTPPPANDNGLSRGEATEISQLPATKAPWWRRLLQALRDAP